MLLASFYMNHKKLFQLVATGDNTKKYNKHSYTEKYKKYSFFVKNNDISRNCRGNIIIFKFFKTAKGTYCLCQVSSVWHSPIRNKVGVGGGAGGVGG